MSAALERPDDAPGDPPGVSIFLAVRDEERHLRAALAQVLGQCYEGPLEVVVAVGPSADRTLEIAHDVARQDSRLVVVENPAGRTPQGLNLAVAAARYDVLVRVDGHSEIPDDYVARAVEVLMATGAANVGGRMVPVGRTPFERAVARAMTSRLGIGAEKFHTGGAAGPAPTVYLGAFRRDALQGVGAYDERFVRAQDWELNHRLRRAGETVWFDPSLAVTYRPRGTWRSLAQQFFRTGQWRRQVVERYPGTASPRYLAAPTAVLGVAAGVTSVAVSAAGGPRQAAVLGALPVAYAGLVTIGSAVVGRDLPWPARLRLAPVIATMHMAWGVGFLVGARTGRDTAPEPHDYPRAAPPRASADPGRAATPSRHLPSTEDAPR